MALGEKIFDEFKEYSIAEFFKKNRQMLGFSGKVRSLTTIVHEYVTNSLDACEEAGILPKILVELKELGNGHYKVIVEDNGPGIPKTHIGKALASMLAGTKFHRYMQQRGQQGIGAAGCTMYSFITTGKPVHVISKHRGKKIECDLSLDFKNNKPIMNNLLEEACEKEEHGLKIEAEFKDVKYDRSNYSVYEYLRRTAIANPHAEIIFTEPNGEKTVFPRSVEEIPPKPKEVKPHPLGISPHDLLDFAKREKEAKRISSFLQKNFARFTAHKINELKTIIPDFDFNKNPKELTWEEAEKLVNAFKKVKWIAPATDAVIPIGKEQIEKSFMNIFNPEKIFVVQRSPKIYRGGIPFVVEVGIAYNGGVKEAGKKGEIMRFANRVPLLFDAAGDAITQAVKGVEWKRYNLKNFEEEPIVVLVNLSSVYVPYVSAGKQAISPEEEIVSEIKNAVMEAARGIQKYISAKRKEKEKATKRKVFLRYVNQLAMSLAELAGENEKEIAKKLEEIINSKYELTDGEKNEKETEKESMRIEEKR